MFSKTVTTAVFSTFSQKCVKRFFRSVYLIKWLHYRPFSGELQTISEYSKKTFFLESLSFLKLENLDCRAVAIVKMDSFKNLFFGILKILEDSIFLSTSRMYLQCSPVVNCIRATPLHTFLWQSRKVSDAAISKQLHEIICDRV